MTPEDQLQPYDPNEEIDVDEYERRLASKLGVPLHIAKALRGVESSGSNAPIIRGPVTRSGDRARGRYQVMPRTARGLGIENPDDPFDNTYAGLTYLRQGYDKAEQYAENDGQRWAMALAHYHGGPGAMKDVINTQQFRTSDATPTYRGMNTGKYAYKILSNAVRIKEQEAAQAQAPLAPSAIEEPPPTVAPTSPQQDSSLDLLLNKYGIGRTQQAPPPKEAPLAPYDERVRAGEVAGPDTSIGAQAPAPAPAKQPWSYGRASGAPSAAELNKMQVEGAKVPVKIADAYEGKMQEWGKRLEGSGHTWIADPFTALGHLRGSVKGAALETASAIRNIDWTDKLLSQKFAHAVGMPVDDAAYTTAIADLKKANDAAEAEQVRIATEDPTFTGKTIRGALGSVGRSLVYGTIAAPAAAVATVAAPEIAGAGALATALGYMGGAALGEGPESWQKDPLTAGLNVASYGAGAATGGIVKGLVGKAAGPIGKQVIGRAASGTEEFLEEAASEAPALYRGDLPFKDYLSNLLSAGIGGTALSSPEVDFQRGPKYAQLTAADRASMEAENAKQKRKEMIQGYARTVAQPGFEEGIAEGYQQRGVRTPEQEAARLRQEAGPLRKFETEGLEYEQQRAEQEQADLAANPPDEQLGRLPEYRGEATPEGQMSRSEADRLRARGQRRAAGFEEERRAQDVEELQAEDLAERRQGPVMYNLRENQARLKDIEEGSEEYEPGEADRLRAEITAAKNQVVTGVQEFGGRLTAPTRQEMEEERDYLENIVQTSKPGTERHQAALHDLKKLQDATKPELEDTLEEKAAGGVEGGIIRGAQQQGPAKPRIIRQGVEQPADLEGQLRQALDAREKLPEGDPRIPALTANIKTLREKVNQKAFRKQEEDYKKKQQDALDKIDAEKKAVEEDRQRLASMVVPEHPKVPRTQEVIDAENFLGELWADKRSIENVLRENEAMNLPKDESYHQMNNKFQEAHAQTVARIRELEGVLLAHKKKVGEASKKAPRVKKAQTPVVVEPTPTTTKKPKTKPAAISAIRKAITNFLTERGEKHASVTAISRALKMPAGHVQPVLDQMQAEDHFDEEGLDKGKYRLPQQEQPQQQSLPLDEKAEAKSKLQAKYDATLEKMLDAEEKANNAESTAAQNKWSGRASKYQDELTSLTRQMDEMEGKPETKKQPETKPKTSPARSAALKAYPELGQLSPEELADEHEMLKDERDSLEEDVGDDSVPQQQLKDKIQRLNSRLNAVEVLLGQEPTKVVKPEVKPKKTEVQQPTPQKPEMSKEQIQDAADLRLTIDYNKTELARLERDEPNNPMIATFQAAITKDTKALEDLNKQAARPTTPKPKPQPKSAEQIELEQLQAENAQLKSQVTQAQPPAKTGKTKKAAPPKKKTPVVSATVRKAEVNVAREVFGADKEQQDAIKAIARNRPKHITNLPSGFDEELKGKIENSEQAFWDEVDKALGKDLPPGTKLNRSGVPLTVGMMRELIKMGAYYTEGGIKTFHQWMAAMINKVGEGVRPYLPTIYKIVRDRDAYYESYSSDDVIEAYEQGLNILAPPKQEPAKAAPVAQPTKPGAVKQAPRPVDEDLKGKVTDTGPREKTEAGSAIGQNLATDLPFFNDVGRSVMLDPDFVEGVQQSMDEMESATGDIARHREGDTTHTNPITKVAEKVYGTLTGEPVELVPVDPDLVPWHIEPEEYDEKGRPIYDEETALARRNAEEAIREIHAGFRAVMANRLEPNGDDIRSLNELSPDDYIDWFNEFIPHDSPAWTKLRNLFDAALVPWPAHAMGKITPPTMQERLLHLSRVDPGFVDDFDIALEGTPSTHRQKTMAQLSTIKGGMEKLVESHYRRLLAEYGAQARPMMAQGLKPNFRIPLQRIGSAALNEATMFAGGKSKLDPAAAAASKSAYLRQRGRQKARETDALAKAQMIPTPKAKLVKNNPIDPIATQVKNIAKEIPAIHRKLMVAYYNAGKGDTIIQVFDPRDKTLKTKVVYSKEAVKTYLAGHGERMARHKRVKMSSADVKTMMEYVTNHSSEEYVAKRIKEIIDDFATPDRFGDAHRLSMENDKRELQLEFLIQEGALKSYPLTTPTSIAEALQELPEQEVADIQKEFEEEQEFRLKKRRNVSQAEQGAARATEALPQTKEERRKAKKEQTELDKEFYKNTIRNEAGEIIKETQRRAHAVTLQDAKDELSRLQKEHKKLQKAFYALDPNDQKKRAVALAQIAAKENFIKLQDKKIRNLEDKLPSFMRRNVMEEMDDNAELKQEAGKKAEAITEEEQALLDHFRELRGGVPERSVYHPQEGVALIGKPNPARNVDNRESLAQINTISEDIHKAVGHKAHSDHMLDMAAMGDELGLEVALLRATHLSDAQRENLRNQFETLAPLITDDFLRAQASPHYEGAIVDPDPRYDLKAEQIKAQGMYVRREGVTSANITKTIDEADLAFIRKKGQPTLVTTPVGQLLTRKKWASDTIWGTVNKKAKAAADYQQLIDLDTLANIKAFQGNDAMTTLLDATMIKLGLEAEMDGATMPMHLIPTILPELRKFGPNADRLADAMDALYKAHDAGGKAYGDAIIYVNTGNSKADSDVSGITLHEVGHGFSREVTGSLTPNLGGGNWIRADKAYADMKAGMDKVHGKSVTSDVVEREAPSYIQGGHFKLLGFKSPSQAKAFLKRYTKQLEKEYPGKALSSWPFLQAGKPPIDTLGKVIREVQDELAGAIARQAKSAADRAEKARQNTPQGTYSPYTPPTKGARTKAALPLTFREKAEQALNTAHSAWELLTLTFMQANLIGNTAMYGLSRQAEHMASWVDWAQTKLPGSSGVRTVVSPQTGILRDRKPDFMTDAEYKALGGFGSDIRNAWAGWLAEVKSLLNPSSVPKVNQRGILAREAVFTGKGPISKAGRGLEFGLGMVNSASDAGFYNVGQVGTIANMTTAKLLWEEKQRNAEAAVSKMKAAGDPMTSKQAKKLVKVAESVWPYDQKQMNDTMQVEAAERVFYEKSAIARGSMALQRGLNFGRAYGLGNILFTNYPRIPANIVKAFWEYSPGGFIRPTFWLAKQMATGTPTKDPRRMSLLFGRAIVGTANTTIAGFIMRMLGVIAVPDDDKDRYGIDAEEGFGRYTINFSQALRLAKGDILKVFGGNKELTKYRQGDKTLSTEWLQPIGLGYTLGASLADSWIGHRKVMTLTSVNRLIDAASHAMDSITEQSALKQAGRFMMGMSHLAAGESDKAYMAWKPMLTGQFSRVIPRILQQVAFVNDPVRRDTRPEVTEGAKAWWDESVNRLESVTPGLSKNLPARPSAYGEEEVDRSGGQSLGTRIAGMLHPGVWRALDVKPGSELLRRLDLSPAQPRRSHGEPTSMLREREKKIGQRFGQYLSTQATGLSALPQDQQKKRIEHLRSISGRAAPPRNISIKAMREALGYPAEPPED